MNKKNLLLVSAFFACLSGQAQHSIKLSELNLSNIRNRRTSHYQRKGLY